VKAQQNIDFSKVEIKTIDLGHNTYRLEGQGGNITVAVGSDGIIMVDGGSWLRSTTRSRPGRRDLATTHQVFDQHPISTEITPAAMKGLKPVPRLKLVDAAPYRTHLHRLNSLLTGKRTGNLAKTGFRCRF